MIFLVTIWESSWAPLGSAWQWTSTLMWCPACRTKRPPGLVCRTSGLSSKRSRSGVCTQNAANDLCEEVAYFEPSGLSNPGRAPTYYIGSPLDHSFS